MNRDQDPQFELDRIGSAVRECLDGSIAQLPSRVTDRLYLARLAAMAARKPEFVPQLQQVLRPQLALNQGGNSSQPSSQLESFKLVCAVHCPGLRLIGDFRVAARCAHQRHCCGGHCPSIG
jgi:hypothetical protein